MCGMSLLVVHTLLLGFLQFSFLLKNQHNFPNSNPTRIEDLCEKQLKAIEANSALKCIHL